jgi:hypothetical protein
MPTDPPRADRSAQTPVAFCLPVEPGPQSCPLGALPANLLFQGSQEILIDHRGETYRLRITKNGKLILTK